MPWHCCGRADNSLLLEFEGPLLDLEEVGRGCCKLPIGVEVDQHLVWVVLSRRYPSQVFEGCAFVRIELLFDIEYQFEFFPRC
jgi:hypothetical protein